MRRGDEHYCEARGCSQRIAPARVQLIGEDRVKTCSPECSIAWKRQTSNQSRDRKR